ncbi:MAG: DMT family transporter [Cyanophyceae cyanobacterium]
MTDSDNQQPNNANDSQRGESPAGSDSSALADNSTLSDEELVALDRLMAEPTGTDGLADRLADRAEANTMATPESTPEDPLASPMDAAEIAALDGLSQEILAAIGETEAQDELAIASGNISADRDDPAPSNPLQELAQELRELQQALLLQLAEDVQRLGAEKARLTIDIDRLQLYRQRLEQGEGAIAQDSPPRRIDPGEAALGPNAREWAQRWAQQLAQHMGQYLNEALQDRFESPAPPIAPVESGDADVNGLDLGSLSRTDRALASLEYRVETVLQGLQRDLDTYESDLVQRLNRMHSLQQQGELVLQSLVHRLEEVWVRDAEAEAERQGQQENQGRQGARQRGPSNPSPLSSDATPSNTSSDTLPGGQWYLGQLGQIPDQSQQQLQGRSPLPDLGFPPASTPVSNLPGMPGQGANLSPDMTLGVTPDVLPDPSPGTSAIVPAKSVDVVLSGLALGLLSTVILALFNGTLKVLFQGVGPLWWSSPTPAVLPPTGGNILLVLALRTLVVLLIFPIVAQWIYPQMWSDLQRALQDASPTAKATKPPSPWLSVIISGIWLFLAQMLGYLAIAHLPLGIAIALFFVYPVVRLLTGWLSGRDSGSPTRWLMGAVMIAGLIMVAPDVPNASGTWSGNLLDPNLDPTLTGLMGGLGAGFTFAGYLISSERSLKRLHPVPFTLLSFSVIFILSCLGLIIQPGDWAAVQLVPNFLSGLSTGTVILALITVISYGINNAAVEKIGPSLVAVTGAFAPLINALLGLVFLGEVLDTRPSIGIVLVAVGAIALSLSRYRDRHTP